MKLPLAWITAFILVSISATLPTQSNNTLPSGDAPSGDGPSNPNITLTSSGNDDPNKELVWDYCAVRKRLGVSAELELLGHGGRE
ncbi:hypothetical protein FQN55_002679 [Onygenales sp. PD_40]|nr:hypothetical protein FQN55_002679 [Onygenales sp. PD_40]KAK2797799.1 hypothetical protein FQN51_008254 [Onygenales sp. PD_10]